MPSELPYIGQRVPRWLSEAERAMLRCCLDFARRHLPQFNREQGAECAYADLCDLYDRLDPEDPL